MNTYQKELEVAQTIAREAGEIILKYFDADQKIEIKADKSKVTIADKEANSLVIKRLGELFPDDGVVGEEESTSEYGMGRKWICDPIDGTAGYTWGTPTAMFSLGLVVDGIPVIGVAYDPFLNKMFVGIKGEQSTCNGKVIHVSSLAFPEGTFGISGGVRRAFKEKYFQKLLEKNIRLAAYSGVVHKACMTAVGRLVGVIEEANAHDVAAVHTIIEGAGGRITSMDGKELKYLEPFKGVVISNGVIHDELLSYLK